MYSRGFRCRCNFLLSVNLSVFGEQALFSTFSEYSSHIIQSILIAGVEYVKDLCHTACSKYIYINKTF